MVGGGVIGMAVARRLARDALRVTLIEREVCGREASWAAAGVLAPRDPTHQDSLFHLEERSLAAYPDFCRSLVEETAIEVEYERCGELMLEFTEGGLSVAKSKEQAAAGRRLPDGRPVYELHSAQRTREIEPKSGPESIGSLECRQTAQVRNPRLLRALRVSCERAGVVIRENTRLDDFVVEGDRVTGVRLDGGVMSASFVVLCAGAWSSGIGVRLASLMPVHPVRGQIVLMKLDDRPFTHVIASGKTYLVPRRDGHVVLGATEERESGFSKRNTASGVSMLMQTALRMVPMLSETPIVTLWAGLRPGTPDDRPYIGPVPGFDGLIAATGHFRSGLSLAPATADVVAAMISGRPYDLDLSCCRPGRT